MAIKRAYSEDQRKSHLAARSLGRIPNLLWAFGSPHVTRVSQERLPEWRVVWNECANTVTTQNWDEKSQSMLDGPHVDRNRRPQRGGPLRGGYSFCWRMGESGDISWWGEVLEGLQTKTKHRELIFESLFTVLAGTIKALHKRCW